MRPSPRYVGYVRERLYKVRERKNGPVRSAGGVGLKALALPVGRPLQSWPRQDGNPARFLPVLPWQAFIPAFGRNLSLFGKPAAGFSPPETNAARPSPPPAGPATRYPREAR